MNILLIKVLCLLFSCNPSEVESPHLKEGFYYGRNKGLFPQNIIYVTIKDDVALVETFLPLKGQFFYTFSDTLILKNEGALLYKSEKSNIYSKKKKVFFKTIDRRNGYNIDEVEITPQPNKKAELEKIRSKAKPFH